MAMICVGTEKLFIECSQPIINTIHFIDKIHFMDNITFIDTIPFIDTRLFEWVCYLVNVTFSTEISQANNFIPSSYALTFDWSIRSKQFTITINV